MKHYSLRTGTIPGQYSVFAFSIISLLSACQNTEQPPVQTSSQIVDTTPAVEAINKPVYFNITDIDEPELSACMQAGDGNFWVASNENYKVIWEISSTGKLQNNFSWLKKPHNDIEGLAIDGGDGFFVITSQSRNKNGELNNKRFRLSHFKDFNFEKNDRRTISKFRNTLTDKFEQLKKASGENPKEGGIDVEGLAYDPQNDRMWFGFRGPLIEKDHENDHALLIQLNRALEDWDPQDRNPPKDFTWAADQPQKLDLGGHGIRDLYYASENQLLILSGLMGSNPSNEQPDSKLWRFNTKTNQLESEPIRNIPQVPDKRENPAGWSAAEGICPIMLDGQKKLLVVYDSNHSGIFQVFDYPDF